jgi:uncharacterized protein (TIGR03067 family)
MKLRFLLAVSAILVVAVAVAAAQEDIPKKDFAKLQGTWKVVALEAGGKEIPEESFKEKRFLIKGDKISLSGKSEDLRPYQLDAAAKPRAIDISGDVEKEFSKAIYEVDGDKLKLCFSQSTKLDRPIDFNTEGTRYLCFTLKRVKADKKKQKGDGEKIQGKWIEVESHYKGKKSVDDTASPVYTFSDKKLIVGDGSGKGINAVFTFELRPDKKPRELDLIVMLGDKKRTAKAIYELSGDTLKICSGRSDEERPKAMGTAADDERSVVVFKRVKSDDKK